MIKVIVNTPDVRETVNKVVEYLVNNVSQVDYHRSVFRGKSSHPGKVDLDTDEPILVLGQDSLWKIGVTGGERGKKMIRISVNNHRGQIGGDVETMLALMYGNIE
jgi:hypothetical protein